MCVCNASCSRGESACQACIEKAHLPPHPARCPFANLVFSEVKPVLHEGGNKPRGSLVVGFDPIGDLVSELRRRFGHLAVFFSPGAAGASGMIGLVWRPSAFVPRPYNVNRSRHMMVVGTSEGEMEGNGEVGVLTTMNVLEVLAEVKTLGGDMIDGVHLS